MDSITIHSDFKLNGVSFRDKEAIITYSKSHSEELHKLVHDWFSDELYLEVKTSGSTGIPKTIGLQKSHIVNSVKATVHYFELEPKSKVLLCLPLDYIAGKIMVIRAIVAGWHLDIQNPTSNPLENIQTYYDFSAMVPLQLENSVSKLNQIRKLIVGGGRVSELVQDQLQASSCQVYETYGMTETITHIAVKKLNGNELKPTFFETLQHLSVYIDDRNCLVIKCPEISDEIIFTNDVVQLISENQFLWLGRFDNIINSGGIKLNPESIEAKLKPLISDRFIISSIPDNRLGEKLILIVERNATSDFSELKKEIASLNTLGKFEKPKEIFAIPKFKETNSGKIKRKDTTELLVQYLENDKF